MNHPEHEIIEYKVRSAAGIHALRKIGAIVAEVQRIDSAKDGVLRWLVRFGWIVLAGAALLAAYATGLI